MCIYIYIYIYMGCVCVCTHVYVRACVCVRVCEFLYIFVQSYWCNIIVRYSSKSEIRQVKVESRIKRGLTKTIF